MPFVTTYIDQTAPAARTRTGSTTASSSRALPRPAREVRRPARPGPQPAQGPRAVPPAGLRPRRRGSTTRPGSSRTCKLPRFQPYMSQGVERSPPSRSRHPADLNADLHALTLLPHGRRRRAARPQLPEALLRCDGPTTKEFEPYIDDDCTCAPVRRDEDRDRPGRPRSVGLASCRRSCSARSRTASTSTSPSRTRPTSPPTSR